ncbi:MAG: vitamin B12-dependent ribonucleotide reductase, partial [Solirubrobacterales bacterium]|nr:vitamin B12-dependent ribonucleotide reductase [Solirubrobacterales bacterium]
SVGLQYGVPLETLVRKFSYMRFEPEGITQNPEIPFAKSMPDYIMRWLASRFLDAEIQEDLGIMTADVRAKKVAEETATSINSDTAGPTNGNGNGNGHSHGNGNGATLEARPAASAMTDVPPVQPAAIKGLELGPACQQCGGMMQRTGSCYTCPSCGNNTGCG